MAIRAMPTETTHFACSPLGCCTLLSISLYFFLHADAHLLRKDPHTPYLTDCFDPENMTCHELLMCMVLQKLI